MFASLFHKLRSRRHDGSAPGPIGLEFGADSLNMVQCRHDAEGVLISAAVSLPYPAERASVLADRMALRKLLRSALAAAPFEGRQVCSAIPANKVRVLALPVHLIAGQSEQAAVIKVLRDKLRSDLSGDIVDYVRVRDQELGGNEINIVAAVAQRRDVLEHLALLELVGMEPIALDIGPAALTRLITVLEDGRFDQPAILINFGLEKAYITVIWGRRLMLDREIDFGQQQLTGRLAKAFNVEPAHALDLLRTHGFNSMDSGSADIGKAITEILHQDFAGLAEEISRTLIYIASKTQGKTPHCIYLNGSLAACPAIAPRMQQLVDIPVGILNPAASLRCSPAVQPGLAAGNMALAAGLALRQ